jgi:DHA1 family bicyclomycin/chloramphenicol resistance-like MFS transporter
VSAVTQEVSSRHQPMGLTEFIVFSSAAMAINSLAISIMLAALPQIAHVFQMSDPNRQQMVLTVFMVGFSAGQLLIGPISDRYGRRATLSVGLAGYAVATLACIVAPSFEMLLAARLVQGLCSATPRIIIVSTVRDCYIGPQMARIMSLVMMVLFIAPIIAPDHRTDDPEREQLAGAVCHPVRAWTGRARLGLGATARDAAGGAAAAPSPSAS